HPIIQSVKFVRRKEIFAKRCAQDFWYSSWF
ncbi:hypothetical protein GCK32_021775, partial [Trichostrongylus colubriformis]